MKILSLALLLTLTSPTLASVATPREGARCGKQPGCRWFLMQYNKYDRAWWCIDQQRNFCPR